MIVVIVVVDRARHQPGRAARAGLPLLLQQAVERHQVRAHGARRRKVCAECDATGACAHVDVTLRAITCGVAIAVLVRFEDELPVI